MDNHAASSCSRPKTPGNATSTGKRPSSASEKERLDAWVQNKEKKILKAIKNWTRAEPAIRMQPDYFPLYRANERSDKNLRYALSLIYRDYGPLVLRYEGCDTLAVHWVSGWDPKSGPKEAVQKVVICVNMGARLPGQSPALDRLEAEGVRLPGQSEASNRLEAEIQADSDEGKNKGKDENSTDSDEEKDKEKDHGSVDSGEETDQEILDQGLTDQEIANFEEGLNDESDSEKADWVDVDSGGVDDGDWMTPNNRTAMVKDAGRMLLEGFRKL